MARPKETEKAQSRRAHIYEALKHDILSLALTPGEDLDEESLAARYEVSRTPIREALIHLSREGLVEVGRNRRARVTALIISNFPRYTEALDLHQRAVASLAAQRRSERDLQNIKDAQARFDAAVKDDPHPMTLGSCNTAFHLAVARAGRNAYLTDAYQHLLLLGQRMFAIPFSYASTPGRSIAEKIKETQSDHHSLILAIEKREAELAEHMARQHTLNDRQQLAEYLNENLAGEISVALPIDAEIDKEAADQTTPAQLAKKQYEDW
ncbi:MAG: GntR family transcriptional regulator [Rhodospirillales bacterium]